MNTDRRYKSYISDHIFSISLSIFVNNFTVIVLVMVRLQKYKQIIVKTSHFLLFCKNWACFLYNVDKV